MQISLIFFLGGHCFLDIQYILNTKGTMDVKRIHMIKLKPLKVKNLFYIPLKQGTKLSTQCGRNVYRANCEGRGWGDN